MSLELEDRLSESQTRFRRRPAIRETAHGAPPSRRSGARDAGGDGPSPHPGGALVGVAAAAAAILAAPWRDGPLATERALAALGDQPVVAVNEHPRHAGRDRHRARRRASEEGQRTEYWYDDERDYLRARVSAGGRLLPGGEYLHTPEGFFTDVGAWRGSPPNVDPALERFASDYREALESGDARVVGEEIVDGRKAVILRFRLPSDDPSSIRVSQEVAGDRGRLSTAPWPLFLADFGAQEGPMVSGVAHRRDRDEPAGCR